MSNQNNPKTEPAEIRFDVIFSRLSADSLEENEKGVLVEYKRLLDASEEIAELRRAVLEITEQQPNYYTTT